MTGPDAGGREQGAGADEISGAGEIHQASPSCPAASGGHGVSSGDSGFGHTLTGGGWCYRKAGPRARNCQRVCCGPWCRSRTGQSCCGLEFIGCPLAGPGAEPHLSRCQAHGARPLGGLHHAAPLLDAIQEPAGPPDRCPLAQRSRWDLGPQPDQLRSSGAPGPPSADRLRRRGPSAAGAARGQFDRQLTPFAIAWHGSTRHP